MYRPAGAGLSSTDAPQGAPWPGSASREAQRQPWGQPQAAAWGLPQQHDLQGASAPSAPLPHSWAALPALRAAAAAAGQWQPPPGVLAQHNAPTLAAFTGSTAMALKRPWHVASHLNLALPPAYGPPAAAAVAAFAAASDAAAAASDAAAINECRRTNNRLRRAGSAEVRQMAEACGQRRSTHARRRRTFASCAGTCTVCTRHAAPTCCMSPPLPSPALSPPLQELFAVLAKDWRSVDAINLCSALHRLAQLGEGRQGAAGGRQCGDPSACLQPLASSPPPTSTAYCVWKFGNHSTRAQPLLAPTTLRLPRQAGRRRWRRRCAATPGGAGCSTSWGMRPPRPALARSAPPTRWQVGGTNEPTTGKGGSLFVA